MTFTVDPRGDKIDGPCATEGPAQVCAERNTLPETTLYVPLQFWFCRNPGLALPLIALQYHEVKINVELRKLDECLWATEGNSMSGTLPTKVASKSLVAASLYVDYVFLDTDERRRMAQNPHEYLIEQLQFTGDESVGSSSNKIKLNFNHPCKELIWVVQKDEHVDYCASLKQNYSLHELEGAQPFNYTDAYDVLINNVNQFKNDGLMKSGTSFKSTVEGTSDDIYLFSEMPSDGSGNGVNNVSDAAAFVLKEESLGLHCWGENPVVTAKLQLNGQDRFQEREGSYFDTVQPFQHHTRAPDSGINVYSFALRPEEHQPSGSCNFSRIDNATLQLVLSNNTVSGSQTAKVRVYATNYNVLRVMSGMGGLAYSN